MDRFLCRLDNTLKKIVFDRPINILKVKENYFLAADDRNSAHLYKYNPEKKEISYEGGEDKGRNVLDCGWLKNDYYYIIDVQNELNIFTTKKI